MQAGAFARALELLATAEAGPLDELQKARLELLRAHIAFASGPARDAPRLLWHAARRFEPLNLELARETYLQARGAAVFAGRAAGDGTLLEISRAALALPPPAHPPGPADLLLEGLALLIIGRPETGRQTIGIFAGTCICRRWAAMGLDGPGRHQRPVG
jgi:hypothetical protein